MGYWLCEVVEAFLLEVALKPLQKCKLWTGGTVWHFHSRIYLMRPCISAKIYGHWPLQQKLINLPLFSAIVATYAWYSSVKTNMWSKCAMVSKAICISKMPVVIPSEFFNHFVFVWKFWPAKLKSTYYHQQTWMIFSRILGMKANDFHFWISDSRNDSVGKKREKKTTSHIFTILQFFFNN